MKNQLVTMAEKVSETVSSIEAAGMFIEDVNISGPHTYDEDLTDTYTGTVRPSGRFFAVNTTILVPVV